MLGYFLGGALVSALALGQAPVPPAPTPTPVELNTALMKSTFRLIGPAKQKPGDAPLAPNTKMGGTGLIVGRPCVVEPERVRYVLVTAAHVLDDIEGEFFEIEFRKLGLNNRWSTIQQKTLLSLGQKAQWERHPRADVAAMYVVVPSGVAVEAFGLHLFATEELLRTYEVHPGDEVLAIGFPLGLASDSLFPRLRSGRIASFPLVPVDVNRTFEVDMSVFQGNSGGPVYLSDRNRTYGGTTHLGGTVQMILGIVTQLHRLNGVDLHLATVAHSSFILETIAMLPAPDC